MQKKVRILMVLLCLFLFPLRVFALENEISGTGYNQSNDDVAEINTTQTVDDTEVVEPTENEELSVEDTENEDSTEVDADDSSSDETSEFDYSQIEGQVHAFDEDTTEENESSIGIDKISITGANFDVIVGAKPIYTGKVVEADQDKYSLAYEAWFRSSYSISYNYSDSSRNTEDSFETFESLYCYYYEFAILVRDGYHLNFNHEENSASTIPVSINGEEYHLYDVYQEEADDGIIYSFIPNISRVSEVENGETIDSIIINDINSNITVGKAPTYTAKVDSSLEGKVVVGNEAWAYEVIPTSAEEDYEFYVHYKDSSFLYEDDRTFDVFENGKTYDYTIFFTLGDNTNLNVNYDEYGSAYYKLILNGKEYNAIFFSVTINEKQYLYFYKLYSVTPADGTYEVTEGGNTTLTSDDDGTLVMTVNGDYALLDKVIVDNEVLHDGYSAVSGSTIITFTNEFLKSLSAGSHDVVITYTDGKSAYTTLTIQEATSDDSEDTTTPVATATSNSVVSNSYTSVIVDSLADDEEEKEDEVATKDDKKDDKKKTDKPEKESLTKTNSTFYIILVIIFLIIIAVPFVIDRKKQ